MFVQSILQDKAKVGEMQQKDNENAFIFLWTFSGGSVKFPRSDIDIDIQADQEWENLKKMVSIQDFPQWWKRAKRSKIF